MLRFPALPALAGIILVASFIFALAERIEDLETENYFLRQDNEVLEHELEDQSELSHALAWESDIELARTLTRENAGWNAKADCERELDACEQRFEWDCGLEAERLESEYHILLDDCRAELPFGHPFRLPHPPYPGFAPCGRPDLHQP